MKIVRGTSTFPGIAIGKIFIYEREEQQNRRYQAEDVQKELRDFFHARNLVKDVLTDLEQKKQSGSYPPLPQSLQDSRIGSYAARMYYNENYTLEKQLLQSDSFIQAVESIIIREKVNAYYAVMINRNELSKSFSNLETPAVRERISGIRRISDRLMLALGGLSQKLDLGEEPFIIVSDYLLPSELMELDREKLLAIVTLQGSTISHVNIVAKNMEIPNLVEIQTDPDWNGKMAIVDGYSGCLYIEPDAETMKDYEARRVRDKKEKEELLRYRDLPDLTADQKPFRLFANTGSMDDLDNAIYYGAAGIGLLRSEFQYLGREDYPKENELFLVYRRAAEAMRGRPVIIRTADLGIDKQADYMELPNEANPLMGNRGIRLCLDRKRMFRAQLRAIYRASAYGNIRVMYPMITSVEELDEIEELTQEIKINLKEKGIPYKDIETGILIETPAAVMIARELAARVDFLGIGTNDLTQYTLAMDRSNPQLRQKYNDHHPAILRMIKMVIDAAHEENKLVFICGELAADPDLTETFLSMGVDALSVVPACILLIRKALSESYLEETQDTETAT